VEASAFIPPYLHESIEFSHFERANDSNLLENVSTLPRDFRHGFWIHTIERFIALANWHDKHPSEVLLHIESDILLMKSFPWTFFAGLESLSWCEFSSTADVASIFFSPNPGESRWLLNQLLSEVTSSPGTTDMSGLNRIRAANIDRVVMLPSRLDDPRAQSFGIFDGASFGMWITGQDPRNHFGLIKRHRPLERSAISAAGLTFNLSSLGFLTASLGTQKAIVHNLHIHSKRTRLLGTQWQHYLRRDLFISGYTFPITTFSPRVFMAQLIEYRRKHGIVSLYSVKKAVQFLSVRRVD